MLRILRHGAPGFEAGGLSPDWRVPGDAVWIELVDPTRAEEVAVEQSIGLLLPTREEMAEIEASSRLYQEDGGTFMTATVLASLMPDKSQVLLKRASEYAENRLVCGVHFRSDITAGQQFGTVLGLRLMENPQIRADMTAALAELRAAHLTP